MKVKRLKRKVLAALQSQHNGGSAKEDGSPPSTEVLNSKFEKAVSVALNIFSFLRQFLPRSLNRFSSQRIFPYS